MIRKLTCQAQILIGKVTTKVVNLSFISERHSRASGLIARRRRVGRHELKSHKKKGRSHYNRDRSSMGFGAFYTLWSPAHLYQWQLVVIVCTGSSRRDSI